MYQTIVYHIKKIVNSLILVKTAASTEFCSKTKFLKKDTKQQI